MNYKKWFDLHIKHKGYDYPKKKVPNKLRSVKDKEHKEQGASVWDYIKYGWDKLWGVVVGAKEFVSDLKSISLNAKFILYAILALGVVYLLIRIS